jgi:hypothetical protein
MKSKNPKNEAYRMLVEKRKSHSFAGLINPSKFEAGKYDCDHVEAWAQWLGNLNAKIMLVGKDFGGTGFFRDFCGGCNPESQTNKNLIQLFSSLGINIGTPNRPNVSAPVFLTNAIFGLIDSSSKGGNQIKRQILQENAKEFLRPLIDIVDPKIIIAMGTEAYRGVCFAFGKSPLKNLGDALASSHIEVSGKLIFPVFHCGAVWRKNNRNLELQQSDWRHIKAYL